MLNCCAVTIWYLKNDDECNEAVDAILSYASFFKSVYIIDNSAEDYSNFAARIKNAVYVPNKKNLGIATALNQDCELAKKDGFEWCMTMDQDSSFDSEQMALYLKLVEENLQDASIKSFSIRQSDVGEQIVSLSKWIRFNILSPVKKSVKRTAKRTLPFYRHLRFMRRKFRHELRKKFGKKEVVFAFKKSGFIDQTITSANIINLLAWETVGKFDDRLFIDEVDNDFCVRLRLNNYKILHFNECYVDHELGKRWFLLFPKINYESDFRLFYIFRNLMIENRRYGKLPFVKNYRKEIFCYFKDYCIFDPHAITHLKIYFRARKAYKEFIKNDPVVSAS